jgi:GT2 family glycosyltransferase
MDLSVIIVTYNSARLIDPLLTALQAQLAGLAAEVLVIDNASKDATVETVRTRHPWVRLIASPENLGFAAGNNRAIAEARGQCH